MSNFILIFYFNTKSQFYIFNQEIVNASIGWRYDVDTGISVVILRLNERDLKKRWMRMTTVAENVGYNWSNIPPVISEAHDL